MKKYSGVWYRIAAATVVATGIVVAWAVVCGWIGSLATSFFGHERVDENLQVALDGTPVISVVSLAGYNSISLSRRTLDGKPWPNDYEHWLGGASLEARVRPPRLIQLDPQWNFYGQRIGGATDGKKPPTAWYLVRSVDPPGTVHWMGYDVMSKLPIGSIGTQGFRVTPPPAKERFELPQGNLGRLGQFAASSQYVDFNGLVHYHSLPSEERPAPWLAFLIDGEHLWQVDLRERSARVVLDVPTAQSIGILRTREELLKDQPEPEEQPEEGSASRGKETKFRLTSAAAQDTIEVQGTFGGDGFTVTLAPPATDEPPRMARVVAVRTDDRVIFYDAATDSQREFKLPEELPNTRIIAYWYAPDELFLYYMAGYWSGGPNCELLWIRPDGTTIRQQHLELQGYVPPPERRKYWSLCTMMPEPLVWLGVLFGADPLSRLQHYQADTYAAALGQTFAICWPMALIVLGVSLATTWYARQLHHRCFRPQPGPWVAFVFLFGLPGLIAYWLEYRRAKLEVCDECGVTVPRDREACASCNVPFPAPAAVGTEIFA